MDSVCKSSPIRSLYWILKDWLMGYGYGKVKSTLAFGLRWGISIQMASYKIGQQKEISWMGSS